MGTPPGAAFRLFIERWTRERRRVCPECITPGVVVPVVHGFPSPQLVTHHRQRLLTLTEMCGFLGPPWACQRCKAHWDDYPFSSSARPSAGTRRLSSRNDLR